MKRGVNKIHSREGNALVSIRWEVVRHMTEVIDQTVQERIRLRGPAEQSSGKSVKVLIADLKLVDRNGQSCKESDMDLNIEPGMTVSDGCDVERRLKVWPPTGRRKALVVPFFG